jgi:hypothetical protein
MHKMISVIILLALSSVSLNAVSAKDKVEVCHKGKEISVAQSAVGAHVGHGDTVGAEDCVSAPETMKVVVMMRCEAVLNNKVLVVSVSSEPELDIRPRDDCAATLAELLDADYAIRSITSGTAEAGDDSLRLYTDYLLIGKVLVPEPR